MTKSELLKTAKPILFNTDMVRAILDERKTQTRRVIKPQPDEKHSYPLGFVTDSTEKSDIGLFGFGLNEFTGSIQYSKPRYRPGDILYVRETWRKCDLPGLERYFYKADDNVGYFIPRWRPSIHMPKEAARILLKVTNVRVERLRDMTDKDALKEGALGVKCDHANSGAYGCTDCMNTGWLEPPEMDFMYIWDSTIKKSDLDLYGYDANPWVWVIEFDRITPEGD